MKKFSVKGLKEQVTDLKQEEIIRVAGELFYKHGFTKTSMDDIAAALSIGKPMIYSYFSSKTKLLAAVCNRTTTLVADLAACSLKSKGTATERLEGIVHDLCLSVIEGRLYLTVLLREVKNLPDYAMEQIKASDHALRAIVVQLLQEGKRDGEFDYSADERVIALAISGMTTWIHTWFRDDGLMTPEQVAQQMLQIVWKIVGKK